MMTAFGWGFHRCSLAVSLQVLFLISYFIISHISIVSFAISQQPPPEPPSTLLLIKIEHAQATSTLKSTHETLNQNYEASNALQKGSDMWCSAEGVSNADTVTWTGWLKRLRAVKGLRIHWGYSPGKYRVETSMDNEHFDAIIDWKQANDKEEYAEDLLFPHPVEALSVKILMEEPIHRYFGINFVAFIAFGTPLVQIASGIISPGDEMCLQSQTGDPTTGTAIVLEGCLSAIARADGRDLFRFNSNNQIIHEASQLCITLQNNDITEGGEIILDECPTAGRSDGRAEWEVLADNRLHLLREGNWCLSQKGSKAGSADLAIMKMAHSEYSRPADPLHSTEKAVDGNSETFWASEDFDYPAGLPEAVNFTIDLGGPFKLQRVEIDWFYPAMRYSLSLSNDGSVFNTTTTIQANAQNITGDDLEGRVARYVRLSMIEPHPEYAIQNRRAAYGIARFSAFANRLKSIVDNCDQIRNSTDVRDKYFAYFVTEFDYATGNSVATSGKRFQEANVRLDEASNSLSDLTEPITACEKMAIAQMDEARAVQDRASNLKRELQAIRIDYADVVNASHVAVVSSEEPNFLLSSDELQLESEEALAIPEDCVDIYMQDPQHFFSGFYFIQPSCAPSPIRIYCDSSTRRGIFVLLPSYFNETTLSIENTLSEINKHSSEPGSSTNSKHYKITRPEEILTFCNDFRMDPYIYSNPQELQSIVTVLKHMNVHEEANLAGEKELVFPIAIKRASDSQFVALDQKTQISMAGIEATALSPAITALGVTFSGGLLPEATVKPISVDSMSLLGGLCVTRPSLLDHRNKIAAVRCDEAARNNAKFEGCPFSSILVECPTNCSSQALGDLPLYGTSTYRDDSSVCLAAAHVHAIGKYGFVNVTFLPGLTSYEGSTQNGIRSSSYSGVVWDRSFQVKKPSQECSPITEKKLQASSLPNTALPPRFKEVLSYAKRRLPFTAMPKVLRKPIIFLQQKVQTMQPAANINAIATVKGAELGDASAELWTMNDVTEEAVSKVLLLAQRLQTNAGAPELALRSIKNVGERLSWARSYIKPTSEKKRKLELAATLLETTVTALSQEIFSWAHHVFSEAQEAQAKLDKVIDNKEQLWGFRATSIGKTSVATNSNLFWKIFETTVPPLLAEYETSSSMGSSSSTDPFSTSSQLPLSDEKQCWNSTKNGMSWFIGSSVAALHGRKSLAVLTHAQDSSNQIDDPCFNQLKHVYQVPPLIIRNKRAFDGTLSLDYYVENGSGSIAVGFRIVNPQNMYIYEIRQEDGTKRLLKILQGRPIELASKQDGGYLNSIWYSLRIHMRQDRLEIVSGRTDTTLKTEFVVSDNSFSGGGYGFFALNADLSLDAIEFIPQVCANNGIPGPPPFPPRCSVFRHLEVGNFINQWHIVNPPGSSLRSNWGYKPFVGGRRSVIVQYESISDSEEQYGALAILKRHRFCTSGSYSIDFFPQCDGLVGAVFHYQGPRHFAIIEVGHEMVRLRVMKDRFTDIVTIPSPMPGQASGYTPGQWNTLLVKFTPTSVDALLNRQPILSQTFPDTITLLPNGRVGLSTWRCGGVAFDKIDLKPDTVATPVPQPISELSTTDWSYSLDTHYPLSDVTHSRAQSEFGIAAQSVISLAPFPKLDTSFFSAEDKCRQIHITDRKRSCQLLVSQTPKGSLNKGNFPVLPLLPEDIAPVLCEYNYCSFCCDHHIREKARELFSEIQKLPTSLKTPELELSLLREKLQRAQSRCIMGCSKNDAKFQETFEALFRKTALCGKHENPSSCRACCEAFDYKNSWDNKLVAECKNYCASIMSLRPHLPTKNIRFFQTNHTVQVSEFGFPTSQFIKKHHRN